MDKRCDRMGWQVNLPGRLMVGLQVLVLAIRVRILARQPRKIRYTHHVASQ